MEDRAEAMFWLQELRKGYFLHTMAITNMRSRLSGAGLALEDIKTSEAEIERLRVEGCKVVASHWLAELRSHLPIHKRGDIARWLRSALSHGNLDFSAVETSEAEIQKLRVTECYLHVQRWLDELHSGTDQYVNHIIFLQSAVLNDGLTLEDVGTSEAGIERLRVMNCKATATKWLEELRDGTYRLYFSRYDFVRCLTDKLSECGLTPENIGMSNIELLGET